MEEDPVFGQWMKWPSSNDIITSPSFSIRKRLGLLNWKREKIDNPEKLFRFFERKAKRLGLSGGH